MITGIVLHHLFFRGSKFMFWAYQNHLLHLLTVVAEDYNTLDKKKKKRKIHL